MNILITGSKGFIGKNLLESLKNIRDEKDRTRPNLKIENIYEYDINNRYEDLEEYCRKCDFIFHLAGVNRPKSDNEFMNGNYEFSKLLLNTLKKVNNNCPIMLSSSIQASLLGRYSNSEYGKSKLAAEELFFNFQKETSAKVYIYRFPNLFGKWCRPNYNSVIATFCYNISHDLPIQINNSNTQLELVYIDDLINEMLDVLEENEHHCNYNGMTVLPNGEGKYCFVPISYYVTLGEVVDLLNQFKQQPKTLIIPSIPNHSFSKKLYSTYLSYLPKEKISFPLKMNKDDRGSFTEIIKSESCGQFSINISKPGITKGQHWHHTKWEFFIVVSGHGLIQMKEVGSDNIIEFEVSGDKIEAVHMLPGYTHNIINLSQSRDLVTVMWANENFDSQKPDTFYLEV